MNDFSDVLILMVAMTLFSSFTLTSARNFNLSSTDLARSDAEYRAIATAQNELDYIKWIDQPSKLNPTSTNYVFNSYPVSKVNQFGANNRYEESVTINAESYLLDEDASIVRYKVIVTVTNTEYTPVISSTVSTIKSFAK